MKVLVCPLNWGLGHATRCIPLIQKLRKEGHEVVVATDGFPLIRLLESFPDLRFIEYPSYNIRYSSGSSQVWAMLRNIPFIMTGIFREHFWLKKLLRSEHFDQVISDNRFGLWCRKAHCIYLSHQLMIKMPERLHIFEKLLWRMHQAIIQQYDACWIPDNADAPQLSGDLSHKYPVPRHAKFIGTLSRFDNFRETSINKDYDVVAVLSGVEPQRSVFEQAIIEKYSRSGEKILIVQGQPGEKQHIVRQANIVLMSHIADEALVAVFRGAKKIIARSGYSTIMDLYALGCLHKAELIPTPGQTEQEYLKKYLEEKEFFRK